MSQKFSEVHSPLKNLKRGKQLVVNACRSGRHRAVANKTAQWVAIKEELYDGKNAGIEAIDLSAKTHWGKLCAEGTCRRCDIDIRNPAESEIGTDRQVELLDEAHMILKDVMNYLARYVSKIYLYQLLE